MSGKVFTARLKIVQECDDVLDEAEVKQWLEEYFSGSDLGDVIVLEVEEIKEKA